MRKILSVATLVAALLFNANNLFAQALDSLQKQKAMEHALDSIESKIAYQHGKVTLKDIADLNVPDGYKFVPAESAQFIVYDLWGNPKDATDGILGLIVKSDYSIKQENSWAFVVTYSDEGYVKDEDADKIDYDDLLKDMQKDEEEVNKERAKQGYPTVHLIGWATPPHYDKVNKVLHWAKKLQFGGNESTTLNYFIRVLGRKGTLNLNAVGTIEQLDEINKHVPDVVAIARFMDGNKYSDFNPSVDKVAAYTIGGLIAGKLIAKTGLLVLLLKNIKLILLAFFGGFAAMRKKIAGWFSRKPKDEPVYTHSSIAQKAEEDTTTTAYTDTTATTDSDDHSRYLPQANNNDEGAKTDDKSPDTTV